VTRELYTLALHDALPIYTGEVGGLRRIRHTGADRIQVDVGHAGEKGGVVEQGLAAKSPLPEAPGAAVLGVGETGDVFVQAAHEPADVGEASSPGVDRSEERRVGNVW